MSFVFGGLYGIFGLCWWFVVDFLVERVFYFLLCLSDKEFIKIPLTKKKSIEWA